MRLWSTYLRLHLALLWNQRYTCTVADVSQNYLQEPEARLWQNEPRCGRCHQVVAGKGAWEGSVEMDRQFGRKNLDRLGNLEHSKFSDTLQRDCAYGKKNFSLMKKLFLLLKLMLCCYYSQNSICSYNDFINFTWYPSEVNKGRDEREREVAKHSMNKQDTLSTILPPQMMQVRSVSRIWMRITILAHNFSSLIHFLRKNHSLWYWLVLCVSSKSVRSWGGFHHPSGLRSTWRDWYRE